MSKIWNRYIKATVGKKIYDGSVFNVEFESEFSNSSPGITTLKIYNPSKETIENCEPSGKIKQTVIVDAGYKESHGVCVMAEIFSHEEKKSGLDRILEIKCGDAVSRWTNERVNKYYPAGMSASIIALDMLTDFGLIPIIEIYEDKVYTWGVSFNEPLRTALQKIAHDTNADLFLRNGRVYFKAKSGLGVGDVLLTPETGLVDKPEKSGKNWKIKSLFNYKLGAGDFVMVKSKNLNNLVKVVKGKHSFNGNSMITEFEAVTI